jgi:hypothetical protein
MRFKFWTQICLPTQFTLDKATGVRSAICIGVLVMRTERLPRNKQGRLAELSLRVDKRGDEHSHDMHSLLEENALLRRILVKLDLVLKKVVDSR